MAETFDPYQAWLGIPPEEQPPDHYRLLGIERFESRPEVIEAAADRRRGALHGFQRGEQAIPAARLIDEIAHAKACLLNPHRKTAYDEGLRQSLQASKSQEPPPSSAEEFLAVLERRDLLPAGLLEGLRRQVAQAKKPVTAAAVAKRLIEAGHLTPALAKRLLSAGSAEVAKGPAAPPSPQAPASQEEDLTLAPLEEEKARTKSRETHTPPTEETPTPPVAPPPQQPRPEDEFELAPLEEEPPAKRPRKPAVPRPAAKEPSTPTAPPDRSLVEEELSALDRESAAAEAGPFEGLMDESQADPAAGSLLAPAPRRRGLRGLFARPKKVAGKTSVWESSLMLVSGGVLLALLILLAVLYFALTWQTGNQALKLANDEYVAGNYTQAVYKYDQYLKRFRDHSGASLARVRRGLCLLRQATAKGATDWGEALRTAERVVPQIATETDFKEAHGELAAILPAIAKGLTDQAHEKTDPELVERAKRALALTNKYVPGSLRPHGKLAEVEATLGLTEHDIARGRELREAIAAMKQAASKGNTRDAYRIRRDLLKRYPRVVGDEGLEEALLEVSRAQRAAVKLVQEHRPPAAQSPQTPLSSLALARRITSRQAPGVEGHVVLAAAAGAAYGLDASTGRVLWRRFLGFDGDSHGPGFPPTPVSAQPGADALLVAPSGNEVVRVAAAGPTAGEPIWRHAVGEPFDAHPVIAEDRLMVATRAGRIVLIDLATGDSAGYIHLPQPLRVAPTVDTRRSLIFQVADHSNLFVLGLADGRCLQVFYIGHEADSITAPPVVVDGLLILVENDSLRDSVLRVVSVEEGEQGLGLNRLQQIRLRGHVDSRPVVADRRMLVATDAGAVYVFEIDSSDAKMPLRTVAESTVGEQENLIRFCWMQGSQFWITDTQLIKYEILASHKRLVRKQSADEDSAFLQPLVAIGQTLFHVRRKLGMPGIVVSAVDMDELTHCWETYLGAPLATEPIVDGAGRITAVTSIGGLFEIDAAARGSDVLDQPTAALQPDQLQQPVTDVVRLGDGVLALATGRGAKRIAVFLPGQQPEQLVRWMLPAPLESSPIGFRGGLLAPSQAGLVFLVDPRTGQSLSEPFQPRLESGMQLPWRRPAAAGQQAAVLTDGRSKVYHVTVQAAPKAHLAAVHEAEVSDPIVSPVAVAGQVAYAVDARGTVVAFQLPELARSNVAALSGACVWGPQRVGDHVMLSDAGGQLFCLDADGKPRWAQPAVLSYGPLAGAPLALEDHYILAASSGAVWRIEADSGKEVGKIDAFRPLGTGPAPLDAHLVVGGHDGTLYEVEQPPE